jgi:hypothetical protein
MGEAMNSATSKVRLGNKSLETVLRTDELYGHDGSILMQDMCRISGT